MEDQAENAGMFANQAELGATLLSPLSTVILDIFLFYCMSSGILICTLSNICKDAVSGSVALRIIFFSIFLTSAWIQLHKDVIALTIHSEDSPSEVGKSPDQAKEKLSLANPMAFLFLTLVGFAAFIYLYLDVMSLGKAYYTTDITYHTPDRLQHFISRVGLLICLIPAPFCFIVITIASILVSLPRIAKALQDWKQLQKVSDAPTLDCSCRVELGTIKAQMIVAELFSANSFRLRFSFTFYLYITKLSIHFKVLVGMSDIMRQP